MDAMKLISSDKVAELLGCSRVTVWRLARAGKLRAVRIGPRLVRYRMADVEALVHAASKDNGAAQA